MRQPVKRHYEARRGVISRPRCCQTGTYYIAAEDRKDTKQFDGGAGFNDPREYDDDAWVGLPSVEMPLQRKRMGFL